MRHFRVFICFIFLLGTNVALAGYKRIDLSNRIEKIELNLSSTRLDCTETDFWGQSWLSLSDSQFLQFSKFGLSVLSNLIDGDCQDVRNQLLKKFASHNNILEITAYFEVYEYIEWGIISEGSPNAYPYCTKTLNEFIHVEGLDSESYSYQTSKRILVDDIDYKECLLHGGVSSL